MSPPTIRSLGNVVYVEFCDRIDVSCNRRVLGLDSALRRESPDWLTELVPAYASLCITYDPRRTGFPALERHILEVAERSPGMENEGRLVEIPVKYGGMHGPDLPTVAQLSGMAESEVVRLHTSTEYRCFMLGFMPGFLYLGELDQRIVAPRLATPRTRVPAGSIGLAGRQTGCYGIESPGGWQIIGSTPRRPFDLSRDPPSSVLPGDRVKFVEERT